MTSVKKLSVAIGVVAMVALTSPSPAKAQHSGVEIWAAVCGRCHTIQPPGRYTAKDWTSIMAHMTLEARLTDAQRDAVLEFLKQGALDVIGGAPQGAGAPQTAQPVFLSRPASWVQAEDDARGTFTSLCVPCHGEKGKGDGPASVAFNPKPADFTNAKLWVGRTDDELVTSITNGVRLMPPFGTQLSQDQIRGLVAYIKTLRGTSSAQTTVVVP